MKNKKTCYRYEKHLKEFSLGYPTYNFAISAYKDKLMTCQKLVKTWKEAIEFFDDRFKKYGHVTINCTKTGEYLLAHEQGVKS